MQIILIVLEFNILILLLKLLSTIINIIHDQSYQLVFYVFLGIKYNHCEKYAYSTSSSEVYTHTKKKNKSSLIYSQTHISHL